MTNIQKLEDHVNTNLLRLAADSIELYPSSYDQRSFGAHDGLPSCNTPCCVAAHMANILNYDSLKGEGMCDFVITRLVTRSGHCRNVARRIFGVHWPIAWFKLTGIDINTLETQYPMLRYAIPSPEDAAAVLRYLADNPEHIIKISS